jgi:outer membrane protein assembly factor BamB/tetratricopeptide (TPR) repeat protein
MLLIFLSSSTWSWSVQAQPAANQRDEADFAGIYVNDSFDAADALKKAQALVRLNRWGEAAQLLQETSDAMGDRLIRISPGFYVGIRQHINKLIASWPNAGITAYRTLYEHTIQSKARTLPDSTKEWLTLFHRFFNTATSPTIGDLIAQRAIESGDLSLAAHVQHQLLAMHPERDSLRAHCETMLALIEAMRGGSQETGANVDPAASVRWMGDDRLYREVLGEIAAGFHGQHGRTSPSTWPVFAGNRQRNRVATTGVDDLGLLWTFDGFVQGEDEGSVEIRLGDDTDRNRRLPMQPIADDRFVVAQLRREIVALHRATGAVAWRFRADSGGEKELGYLEEHPPGWDSPTLHDGRLYAAIPGDTVPYYSYESAHSPPELVCLDAQSGRVIWRVDQEAIEEAFAEIVFDSSPLVHKGHMYVVGRRQRSFGFADSYLFRFDANSGAIEHRTHLGSASTSSHGSRQVGRSIAAMHGDTVFTCTNLGSVAAVSAHTGATKWLRLYAQSRDEGTTRDAQQPAHTIMLSGDRLILFPTDSSAILVLDSRDGAMLHSISAATLGDAETLLAVDQDRIYTSGHLVSRYDLDSKSLQWSSALAKGDSPYGLGVLTSDRLLLPTLTRLCSFALADGTRTDAPWPGDRTGGNLLAAPDQVLVAGAGRIAAYVRKSQIWTRLHERMAAAPMDPLPALELAEIAVSNGDYAEALDALRESVHRADRRDEPVEPDIFKRLYDDAVAFADRFAAKQQLDADALTTLFAIAARYAPDPAAHVAYRFRFAELFVQAGHPDRAVATYQQILRDRTLRMFSMAQKDRESEPAGRRARAAIDEIIRVYGNEAYESFAVEAGSWYEQGRGGSNMDMLQRVVDVFPNSPSAPLALIAMGDVLTAQGDPIGATRYFAHAYHRYAHQVDRPWLLRRIADGYEAGGKVDYAYLWLTKATREFPNARFTHNGLTVNFDQYRLRLAHVRNRVQPSLPHLAPPLTGRLSNQFSDAASLLVPRYGHEPESDWSQYYVYTSKGILAYDSHAGSLSWPKPVPVRVEASLLIATQEIAVFATPYEILGVDVRSGDQRWSHQKYPKHLDQVDGDWEDGRTIRTFAYHRGRLVRVRDDGKMAAIDIETGRVVWTQNKPPMRPGRMSLSERWLIYEAMQDRHTVICLIDAETGAWVDTIATTEKSSAEAILLTIDEQAILVTSQAITAFDLDARSVRWRTPTDGHPQSASLKLDLDVLYFSDDGRSIRKISLEDGRILWSSQRMTRHGDHDLTVLKQNASIVVSTSSSIGAVDELTGLMLWNGTTRDQPNLVERLITPEFALVIDRPRDENSGDESVAYFYDLRNGSGVIPRNGGATKLGDLKNVRAIMAVDGALLIQTGQTIQGWNQE